jgi:hypothetical protein
VEVDASDSTRASLVGSHWAAVRRYLEDGDESALRPFRRRRAGGHRFETDPNVIDELARAGELRFEDIYRS